MNRLKDFLVFLFFVFIDLNLHAEDCIKEQNVIVLNLETALSTALNNNRQLINTVEGVTKAQYQVELVSSEFDLKIQPNADIGIAGGGSAGTGLSTGIGFDFNKKLANGTRLSISPMVMKVNRIYNANIKTLITQPLLRGRGRDYNLSGLHAAEYALRSSSRALYSAQSQLIFRTTASLYEVIKAKKNLELTRESLKRIERFYRAAKLKAKIGVSDCLDVYRAEIELSHAEDALKMAEERYQDAKDHVSDLLALSSDVDIKVEVPLKYTPVLLGLEEAINVALKNRIEIEQAEDQKYESERLSRVAKDRLWPELNFVLNYSNCGADQVFSYACLNNRQTTWGFGFTTSTDFNPIGERIAFEQSLMMVDSAERNIEQTKTNITFEVKKTMRNIERAYHRIELQKEEIHTAEGELKLCQIKFDRGMVNNFDLIQMEKTLRNAQLSYWNALIDHIIGEVQLLGVLGVLMDRPVRL